MFFTVLVGQIMSRHHRTFVSHEHCVSDEVIAHSDRVQEFDLLMEPRLVDRLHTCRLWLSLVDISCHNVTSSPALWGKC